MNGRDLVIGLAAGLAAAASLPGRVETRLGKARAGHRNGPIDDLTGALDDAANRLGPTIRPVLAAGTYLQLRALANAVKSGSPVALRRAAEHMAPLVPAGADLVPVPSSSGSTSANLALAGAIAARAAELGIPCHVVDALAGGPRASSLKKKRAGEPSLLARQMLTRAGPSTPTSNMALLVDNVIATGATARAAATVLAGTGVQVGVLALAVTADPTVTARRSWAANHKDPLASPWFTRWFGESKVVTPDGQPIVTWHGHPVGTPAFDAFDFDRAVDLGMHFGTRQAALDVGRGVGGVTARPFYLSIQRPLRLADPGDWIAGNSFSDPALDQAVARGAIPPAEAAEIRERILFLRGETLRRSVEASSAGTRATHAAYREAFTRYRVESSRLVRDLLEQHGYDGVVYENHDEDAGSTSWIAFHPEQIKAAGAPGDEHANIGTFDPENTRIHLNRTGSRNPGETRAGTGSAYPGPILAPDASPDAIADAYLALRRAVPDLVLLRVLHDFAEADMDGQDRPGLASFDRTAYFMSPEGMARHLRAGKYPDIAPLLAAMPGAWSDAIAMARRVRARQKAAAAVAARKRVSDARWEAQGVVLDPWAIPPARRLHGKEVWLYHGTTSKFLPRILRDGLVPGNEPPRRKRFRRQDRKSNSSNAGDRVRYQPHVFLTANADGNVSSASWYARGAATTHGGDPVILRVLVPWDDLGPDPDDADIASGRYQFVIDRVPPGAILEVDGKRRKPGKPA